MSEYRINKMIGTADAVRYHAERAPDRVATIFGDREVTYADLDRYASQVANGLIKLGIKPQERVGYLGKNTDYFVQLQMGAGKANAVLTPINWRLAAPEVEYIADHADVKVLVVGPEFRETIEDIKGNLPELETIMAMDGPYESSDGEWPDFADWRDAQDDTDPMLPHDRQDVAFQLYTSGTTGKPKGVMLTNDTSYVGFGYEPDYEKWKGDWREIHPGEIALCITPNFHLSGNNTIFGNLRNGMTIVIHPEFDIEAVVRDVIKYKVTRMMMVPAVLRILLDRAKEGADLSSLQVITYGASPIPLETMREATEILGCGFVQMYGMTELGSTITYLEPEDHDPKGQNPKMSSAGRPAEEFDCKIVNPETREELPYGEAGEIAIWSPAPMKGYYKQPEATEEVLDEEGWYYSGDVGIMDEDGYVYIQDRLKDMIVTGGENVYSAEVESALFKHPDVKDVAVFGIPSQKWGEAVHAHVVKDPQSDLTADELIAYAREQIAGYKVPKSIEFVEELPRNASGKLLKHVMREPYWKDQKRRVG